MEREYVTLKFTLKTPGIIALDYVLWDDEGDGDTIENSIKILSETTPPYGAMVPSGAQLVGVGADNKPLTNPATVIVENCDQGVVTVNGITLQPNATTELSFGSGKANNYSVYKGTQDNDYDDSF